MRELLSFAKSRDLKRVALRICGSTFLILFWLHSAAAVVLWSDTETTEVRNNGPGTDLLGGAIKRDDLANDTLYFKFHVDPLSDETSEPYSAGLELFEGDSERLGIGNAMDAWAYSAWFGLEHAGESNRVPGYIDLHSARPDPADSAKAIPFQYPHRGVGVTIVFKVQYVVGGDDLVTAWLNPDLGPGATEVYQPEALTTRFNANAAFDEIRLRHSGKGDGWRIGDLAVATAFSDHVDVSSTRPTGADVDVARNPQLLHFRSWLKEQGLPQAPVRAITQTRDGYIWIGSDIGVTRFDGLRFVSIGESTSNRAVRTLLGDCHGALWIGTATGLKRWADGNTTEYSTRNGLPSDSITALSGDNQGRIWIGTEAGLVVWDGTHFKMLSNTDGLKGHAITAIATDKSGNSFVGVKGKGVFRCVSDRLSQVRNGSVDEFLETPHCFLVDHVGRLWVGAGEDVVLCQDNEQWHRYRIPRHLARPFVSALAEELDGTIWAGSTGGGLLQFTDGKFTTVPASSRFSGNLVESMLVDREGKLWVGTDEGLNQLQRKSLFALGQNEGLGFGPVQGLAQVSPGVIWAVKPNEGIYRWEGRSFNRLRAAGLSLHSSQINTLLAARDGACWIAGANGLLRYKDPIAAADEAKLFELPGANIISLAEALNGTLWAGTLEGKLWQLRQGKWMQTEVSFTNAITTILPNADGSLWIGTEGSGLYHLLTQTRLHVDRRTGLASDMIRALHADSEGALWIGTAGGGLSRWFRERVSTVSTREGLPDNTIQQILEDDVGRLWLGTARGIVSVPKKRLNDLAEGRISTVYPKVFGRADGMLAEECTGGFCPAGLKTTSGLLLFSTIKGVVAVAPHAQPVETVAPSVVLEEILIDGVPCPNASPRLRIGPGKHRVEFRYTGLCFDAPEPIRFRYKLEGWDTQWVEAGTTRTAIYSYVPPGEYRFSVIACNSDGIWTEHKAELAVTFQRYFWQSWWFIGIAGVGVLGSVAGGVRLVEKQKMRIRLKRLEQERALEQERTRIAQDLHDEMGAKLCRISFLSEHARRGTTTQADLREQITAISDDSREVLQSLDEIVWAVNPQNDTLEHVASYIGQYAEEYFQTTGIKCELDIPTQLPSHPVSSQVRHHLFLAVREALTNILKHSGATQATVSIRCDNSKFELAVQDNGKGFDAPEACANQKQPAPGNGLRNMKRRLSDFGGECHFEAAPDGGAIVKFILPIHPTKTDL